MKADEYMVLQMAVEEGVSAGFLKIFPDDERYESPDYMLEARMEAKMVDCVMDAILSWFHIERSWIKESNV